jgi:hypothetical protein
MGNSGIWTEDVTIREIPKARLAAMGWMVLVLVTAGMIAWEFQMRSLGLQAGDLDDGPSHWAVERRKVETGDHDDVVIFGSSRLLFDTDLDAWEQITGRRPIQLALPGTNPRPFLVRFANESDFAGLVVVDVTPELYFSALVSALPEFRNVQDFWLEESPSQRFGHQVGLALSRHLAFLEDQYTLTTLIERIEIPNRKGVRGPWLAPWKLSESMEDRQTRLWPRLETDERLRDHAVKVWMARDRGKLDAALLERAIDESRQAIAKIRARGGFVVFVRPPSTGAYYEREARNTPRGATWDRLIRETGAFGIHFDDYPEMQGLELPELSHLSPEAATRFTSAYVNVLVREMPWLRRHEPAEPGG